jgi:hypothetical protein
MSYTVRLIVSESLVAFDSMPSVDEQFASHESNLLDGCRWIPYRLEISKVTAQRFLLGLC